MNKLNGWWIRLRRALRPRAFDQQMAGEMRAHLEAETARRIALGEDPATARQQAAIAFGQVDSHQERVRDHRLGAWLEQVMHDVRYASRLLRKAPGFTVVVVAILALGIAANTSIFSALNSVLFRPLPYPDPDRMVQIVETRPDGGTNSVSGGAFGDWRDHETQLDAIALTHVVSQNLRTDREVVRLHGLEVSHEFLNVMGKPVLRGRAFQPGDDQVGGASHVVLLTEELWRSRFGGDESVVGRTIILDDVPREVIGIVSAGTWLYDVPQFFVPAVLDPAVGDRAKRFSHWSEVLARMKPGVSAAQLEAELQSIKQRLAAEYPDYKQAWSVRVLPLHTTLADRPRSVVLTLAGAVALVLLIACANVANLLLARSTQRRGEISLRAALGASGRRLVRQALTESMLLAVIGGVCGIVLSYWGTQWVGRLSTSLLPQALAPDLDLRVLAVSLAITGATGILFGLLPAWHARRPDLNQAMKSGGKSTTISGRHRSQSSLVVAELALTLMLLAAAGLLMRSLLKTTRVDPGLDLHNVLTFDLSLPETRYPSSESRVAFITGTLRQLAAVPGVQSVGSSIESPFVGGSFGEYFSRVDQPETRFQTLGRVNFIAGDYLAAMGMRLLRGRTFASSEFRPDPPKVILINQSVADAFFPNEDPVGQAFNIGGAVQEAEIIGVVADARPMQLDRPPGFVAYASEAFQPTRISLVVRSAGLDPLSLAGPLRTALGQIDPGVPMANTRSLEQAMSTSLGQRRLVLALVGGFAACALVLACVGLYGVMSYTVATRRRELSIRLALGAARRDIVGLILRDAGGLTILGLAVGLAGTLAAARLITSQLYEVKSYDPTVLALAAFVLGSIALIACWLPARRAARADPITALRNDG